MQVSMPCRRPALLVIASLLTVGTAGSAHARPGDLDPSFAGSGALASNLATESEALRVVVQDDGKLVVGGIVVGDRFEVGVVRYLPDGAPDLEFGTGGVVRTIVGERVEFSDLALQGDGRIVVAATSDTNGASAFTLLRYDTDGTLDDGFGEGGVVQTTIGRSSTLEAIAVQPDGAIVAAGRARTDSRRAIAVARYERDGALDTSFGDDGTILIDDAGAAARADALALQTDGAIVVAGSSATQSGGSRFLLARLDAHGALDPSFGDGGLVHATPFVEPFAEASAVGIQPDGRIVVAGVWGCRVAIGRYTNGGDPDPQWGGNGFTSLPVSCDFFRIHDLAITPRGKVVLPGSFDFSIAQLTSTGSLDAGFGSEGRGADSGLDGFASESVALQSDGRIVVAGRASVAGKTGSGFGFAVARFAGDVRQSRVELSPDQRLALVSKDVGSERWAIARALDDGSVTGNVFRTDGAAHFVWCEDVTPRGNAGEITLSCFGAERCAAAPCPRSDWRRLSEVRLPSSFFTPDGPTEWRPLESPVVLPDAFFAPPSAGEPDERASSIQIARDRASVLVGKDLGGERWVIRRSLDDGSVSGNVFDPRDGSADILWCTPAAPQPTPGAQTLSCFVAGDDPQELHRVPPR